MEGESKEEDPPLFLMKAQEKMDDDEIYEMWDFLEGEIGRDYSYTTFKEAKVLICEDYVCEIAAQAIRDMKLPWHEVMQIARVAL